jgi:hypothetical protein
MCLLIKSLRLDGCSVRCLQRIEAFIARPEVRWEGSHYLSDVANDREQRRCCAWAGQTNHWCDYAHQRQSGESRLAETQKNSRTGFVSQIVAEIERLG